MKMTVVWGITSYIHGDALTIRVIKINYFFLPSFRIRKFASPFKLNGRSLSLTQNGGGGGGGVFFWGR
jgi:hypothetical protein